MRLRPALRIRSVHATIGFGLAIVAALTFLRWTDPIALRDIRDSTFDQYQRLSPRPNEAVPVRIVDIDEKSLKELGQWPWPRTLVAKLLARLGELGAAVVAFDVLFSEPDRMSPKNILAAAPNIDAKLLADLPDNDQIFAAEIARQSVVLGFAAAPNGQDKPGVKAGFAFTGESPLQAPPHLVSATVPLPILAEPADGLGDISMNPEQRTGVVRAIPLFFSDGAQLYPSLTLEALRVAQGASTYILANAPERPNSIGVVKVGAYEIPTTATGALWMYMNPERADRYISASDILTAPAEKLAPLIAGQIVFIGTSAAGLLDIRATPLGKNVPGVSIHAQAVEQILTGRFLSRPDWADGLEVLSVALLGVMVVMLITFLPPWIAVIAGSVVAGGVVLVSWVVFRQAGILLDPVFAVGTALITQFGAIGFRFLVTDSERRRIRRAFGQYVSPSVLARAENQPDGLSLGGIDREVTLMFMDVRNFTTISEGMAPTDLVRFLNKLLSGLSRHVMETEGTLDKFIGDSIMAFWNAPVDVAQHTEKAARCALAMRQTLREMNDSNAFGMDQPIAFGVGLNTGIACVGNMGAESRFNYSAVGDAVNTAARIESASKDIGFDLLISETSARQLPKFALLDAGSHALKGKSEHLRLFLLVGDENLASTAAFQDLRAAHDRLLGDPGEPLLAEAITFANAVMPELEKFYRKLGI